MSNNARSPVFAYEAIADGYSWTITNFFPFLSQVRSQMDASLSQFVRDNRTWKRDLLYPAVEGFTEEVQRWLRALHINMTATQLQSVGLVFLVMISIVMLYYVIDALLNACSVVLCCGSLVEYDEQDRLLQRKRQHRARQIQKQTEENNNQSQLSLLYNSQKMYTDWLHDTYRFCIPNGTSLEEFPLTLPTAEEDETEQGYLVRVVNAHIEHSLNLNSEIITVALAGQKQSADNQSYLSDRIRALLSSAKHKDAAMKFLKESNRVLKAQVTANESSIVGREPRSFEESLLDSSDVFNEENGLLPLQQEQKASTPLRGSQSPAYRSPPTYGRLGRQLHQEKSTTDDSQSPKLLVTVTTKNMLASLPSMASVKLDPFVVLTLKDEAGGDVLLVGSREGRVSQPLTVSFKYHGAMAPLWIMIVRVYAKKNSVTGSGEFLLGEISVKASTLLEVAQNSDNKPLEIALGNPHNRRIGALLMEHKTTMLFGVTQRSSITAPSPFGKKLDTTWQKNRNPYDDEEDVKSKTPVKAKTPTRKQLTPQHQRSGSHGRSSGEGTGIGQRRLSKMTTQNKLTPLKPVKQQAAVEGA